MHPHIVQYFGICPNGRGIVLELMDGCVLDFFGSLNVSNKITIAIHIGSALAELHRKGYIHRDVAARNVLLRRTVPEPFIAKLSDFGKTCRLPPEGIICDHDVVVACKCL